jgi:muramoyltetrapeptide carboxypeptidase
MASMIQAPNLQKGDTIALISPAKAIEKELVVAAQKFFEDCGFHVLIGQHACGVDRYFSGTDDERASDLQAAIDHPDVKAIVCNRGGYGAVHLLNRVNWANLLREPRWILGFSDITYFHCFAQKLGIQSIHSTMPLNFAENTQESLDSMLNTLKGLPTTYQWASSSHNKTGEVQAELVGGNLSILYALLGTTYCPNFENKILFIEDVGEQYYHLDRIFWSFHYAGIWNQISGLIVGGMTGMKDTENPTNWTIESLVKAHTAFRKIPIAFDAPVGHINDNRSFIIGRTAQLRVTDNVVEFSQ